MGEHAVSAIPPNKARRLQIRMDDSVPLCDNTRTRERVKTVKYLAAFDCLAVAHRGPAESKA
jgi:hypothetical protein